MIFGIIKHLCKENGKMLIKKIVSVILSLSLVFMVSGCDSDKDNPLHGKDTDERIVMCLENAYPEHNFKVVKSFDKQKNEGLFEDENGISFKVRYGIFFFCNAVALSFAPSRRTTRGIPPYSIYSDNPMYLSPL